MRKGFSSLIVIFVLSVVAMFVFVAWQSRILLSISRSQSLSDMLKSTYIAESWINDVIARFVGNYPAAFSFPFLNTNTLGDGTVVKSEGVSGEGVEKIKVTASRQFASSGIELERRTTALPVNAIDNVKIVLNIDCTRSMNNKADAACTTGCTSRMHEAKLAARNFAEAVKQFNTTHAAPVLELGLSTFALNSKWVTDSVGNELVPGSDIDRIIEGIDDNFSDTQEDSRACRSPLNSGATNIGVGLEFMNNYFVGVGANIREKRIEVVITDGEPNSTNVNDYCGATSCTLHCADAARRLLACDLAKDSVLVSEVGKLGLRPEGVEAYSVTISNEVAQETKDILTSYSNQYFDSANATKLNGVLQTLLSQIIESSSGITIRRVLPL